MRTSADRELAVKLEGGRGSEQVLNGERRASGRGGLIIGVGKELASDVLRRRLGGT